tara:strand:+ start:325 stop:675 length:351 start_codon:yes stop_codon:yes gene_type:complete
MLAISHVYFYSDQDRTEWNKCQKQIESTFYVLKGVISDQKDNYKFCLDVSSNPPDNFKHKIRLVNDSFIEQYERISCDFIESIVSYHTIKRIHDRAYTKDKEYDSIKNNNTTEEEY